MPFSGGTGRFRTNWPIIIITTWHSRVSGCRFCGIVQTPGRSGLASFPRQHVEEVQTVGGAPLYGKDNLSSLWYVWFAFTMLVGYVDRLTSFSFSSSISSLAAMQFLVSRKAFLCACSIKLCTNRPTRLTETKTRKLAHSYDNKKRKQIIGWLFIKCGNFLPKDTIFKIMCKNCRHLRVKIA